MIFIDANIPIYLVGGEHPHKHGAAAAVENAIRHRERLVTDVEVLQEILHRFAVLKRLDAIQSAFDTLLGLVDDTLPITRDDLLVAKEIIVDGYNISARDALHLAVMRRHEIDTIMTFDQGFERYPGIKRVG